MRELLQISNFHHFSSSTTIPHPPLMRSPLSQNGRGFLDCVEPKAVCHWARIFEPLISFANFIFLLRSPQLVLCLLPQGEGGCRPDEGIPANLSFSSLFLICNNPSPTADAVPHLPKRVRVFHSLIELRSILLKRNFMDERLPTVTARPTTS